MADEQPDCKESGFKDKTRVGEARERLKRDTHPCKGRR